MSEINSEFIIAIDFGTTYTGVAYAHSKECFTPKYVFEGLIAVVNDWPNASFTYREKTPTTIAYRNGELISWGAERIKSSNSTQIRNFKLGLEEESRKHYFPSSYPESLSALAGYPADGTWNYGERRPVDFVTDYLKAVLQYLMEKSLLREYGQEFLASQHMKYVLTVPVIWSDRAKSLFKTAAILAGIPQTDLQLVAEPEAAALYSSISCGDVNLKDGDRFLICDAGGLTVVLHYRSC